jgi:toxin ParE1/3/4
MFSLTKQALEDLREIGRYTQERWGREQRRLYLALLDRCFLDLAENPNQGQRCDEVRTGYRKFPSGQHVVFTASRLPVASKLSASCMKEWIWKPIFNYSGICLDTYSDQRSPGS